MKKIIVSLGLIVLSASGFAQTSSLGNWLIYFGNKKLNNKWNLHHEVQYRNYDAIGDMEQLLLRTGLGYNLSENNNNVLLGYGFIKSQNYIPNTDSKATVDEHRVFQQFITRQSFSRVKLQHRYRIEERWVENTNFRMRFRYFLSLNIALNNSDITDNTWYGSVYNEIFVNNRRDFFDRNRLYTGIGYKLNKTAKFELGYMNQFLNNGIRDQINVITFLTF